MGAFDQAARFAARADPGPVIGRLSRPGPPRLAFRGWLDTRALPLPGGQDRTADLVASADDAERPDRPWLLVFEFQSQPDAEKLDVSLQEVIGFRLGARPGRGGRYAVMAAFVHLTAAVPEDALDMTLGGSGTSHRPLRWVVASDGAGAALDDVASDRASWGLLFWVPLMAGAEEAGAVDRWRELAEAKVADEADRVNLIRVALVFAELSRRTLVWERIKEMNVYTESQVVNEWILTGVQKAQLDDHRSLLLRLVQLRFKTSVPPEVVETINSQPSVPILRDWFDAASTAATLDEFVAVLRR
ncbi:MAG: hypothetical protein ACRC33_07085 [Gemmataceae bacterium]